MDIQILYNFLVVAREGNISKAADRVHLTQSSLSRQMINLERELAVQLFERENNLFRLTLEGRVFYHRADEIVTLSLNLQEEVMRVNAELTGTISMGLSESLRISELGVILEIFRDRYPRVVFELRSGSGARVREWLENELVEFAFLGERPGGSRYVCVPMVKKDEWGILLSDRHQASLLKRISARELAELPIMMVSNRKIQSEFTIWSGQYAESLIPVMYYDSLTGAAELLRDGRSAAVCAKPAGLYPGMVFLPFEPGWEFNMFLVWRKRRVYSRVAQLLIHQLKLQLNPFGNSYSFLPKG